LSFGEQKKAGTIYAEIDLEPGFPAEFVSIRAEPVASGPGVLVSWETSAEREIVGFNVLRARPDRGEARVNPVWIPSVGEASGPAAYSFVDADAEPGVAYRYRVEAVTLEGLASRSETVPLDSTP
jgi:fibronectin type 3 domain-containing protein